MWAPMEKVTQTICPHPMVPLRAHFLQGALSEEDLAQLGGQKVATLSPTIRWEIRNISGVCWQPSFVC